MRIVISGTRPLQSVELRCLSFVHLNLTSATLETDLAQAHDSRPTLTPCITRRQVVWSRSSDGGSDGGSGGDDNGGAGSNRGTCDGDSDGATMKLSLPVEFPLSPSSGFGAQQLSCSAPRSRLLLQEFPETQRVKCVDSEVCHELQLRLTDTEGKEAWNSVAVCLHRIAPSGAPAGTLHPVLPPPKAEYLSEYSPATRALIKLVLSLLGVLSTLILLSFWMPNKMTTLCARCA